MTRDARALRCKNFPKFPKLLIGRWRGYPLDVQYHRDLVFLPLPVASSIKVPWFVFEVWASVKGPGSLSGGWG
jgi:hypothetical protein